MARTGRNRLIAEGRLHRRAGVRHPGLVLQTQYRCGQSSCFHVWERLSCLMARRIEIFDTTLRDGNKLPFVVLSAADRLVLARQLAKLRVDVIEAGFPATSAEEADCVTRICSEVRGLHVAALARALAGDVQKALECLRAAEKPYLHVFMSVSPQFLRQVLRMNEEEALKNPFRRHSILSSKQVVYAA